ncbi:hypothetical protein QVD17_19627 [Tagetes erecta]|uniref:Uncharacterized protein n=1 Tax=Tagetes erecta TaxID=13708 RepID=A0AAD8KRB3_TARER|nr:hypothetical protein QVD17_19627 [Tagetes erecta]
MMTTFQQENSHDLHYDGLQSRTRRCNGDIAFIASVMPIAESCETLINQSVQTNLHRYQPKCPNKSPSLSTEVSKQRTTVLARYALNFVLKSFLMMVLLTVRWRGMILPLLNDRRNCVKSTNNVKLVAYEYGSESLEIYRLKGIIDGLVVGKEMEKAENVREKAEQEKKKAEKEREKTEKENGKIDKENMLERMIKMEEMFICLTKQLTQVKY